MTLQISSLIPMAVKLCYGAKSHGFFTADGTIKVGLDKINQLFSNH
jgi:hypothetical protein